MPEPDRQPPLPAEDYCWRCQNRRVLVVAATAVTVDGDRYCVQELVPCPACRRPEE
jgi:hypothetical protein